MVKPNRSCTFGMTKKLVIYCHLWANMALVPKPKAWQSHSFSTCCCKKGVRIMLKKRHTWPHLTKCIAVMTKKDSRSRMTKKTLIFGVPGKQMFSNFFSSICGQIWPWFRSQRHGKAIVFQHFVAKKAYGSCWKTDIHGHIWQNASQ